MFKEDNKINYFNKFENEEFYCENSLDIFDDDFNKKLSASKKNKNKNPTNSKILGKTIKDNKEVIEAFIDLSKVINAEIDMEICIGDDRSWDLYGFSTDNNPYQVTPVKKLNCQTRSWNIHTHPTVRNDKLTGLGNMSSGDIAYYTPRLMDQNDNLECGCAVGERDAKIDCLCNFEKFNKKLDKIEDYKAKY